MSIRELIETAIEADLIPFLEGPPGVGKSSHLRAVADSFNLKLIDVRLSTLDPTDLTGIPFKVEVDLEDGTKAERVRHVPSTLFPLQGDALPPKLDANGKQLFEQQIDAQGNVVLDGKGKPKLVPAFYDGWLVMFDEITSASPNLQAATYRVLLEREVAESKLHDNVVMCAAGNREQDKAVVFPMSTALRTRMCFIEVDIDHKEWIKWATAKGIYPKIVTYLHWKREALNDFDPNIKQLNCAVPRTWEMASRLLTNSNGVVTDTVFQLLKGVIGTHAIELKNFINIFAKLPDIKKIIANPATADVPAEAGHQYALASVLADEMANDLTKTASIAQYINRMEPELQVVAIIEAGRKNKKVFREPALGNWVSTNVDLINASI